MQWCAEQREQSRSVLLVSHSLADVEHLCDRIAVLVHGRRVFLGTVTELTQRKDGSGVQSLEQALHNLYQTTPA